MRGGKSAFLKIIEARLIFFFVQVSLDILFSMHITAATSISAYIHLLPDYLVATASVERSFSQMKMIKTRSCNRMGGNSFHLMKLSIESPEKLSDSDLENIVYV